MKKKILYLFLIGFITIIPKNIMAKANGSDTCSAVLQMNKLYKNGTRYFSMSLNGAQAFCIDPGYHASSGNICTYDSAQTATTAQLKIVNYAARSNIVSQTLGYNEQQEVYISLSRGESLAKILKGRSDAVALEAAIITEFNSTSVATLGSDAVILTCGDKQQRMIALNSALNCIEQSKPATCPGGAMSVSGGIGSCTTGKGGNTYAFSNTAGPGSQSNIHRQYGIEKQSVGEYCSLYCQEYGEAVLPGATGEPFNLGSYIIWPTSNSNHDNVKFKKEYYPLKFRGTLECKLGVQPDDNMPGTRGECKNDPIEDYKDNRANAMKLYNKTDYNGQTFEYVRKNNIGRTKNASAMCTANYDTGGKSCTGESKCLTPARKRLAKEQQILSEYQKDANNVDPKTYDYPLPNGDFQKRNTPAYDDALKKVAGQQKVVNTWIENVNRIEETINTCTNYTKYFERSCDILQAMSYCGEFTISEDLYDFNSNASMQYSDEEYNTGTVVKESSSKSVTKQSPTVIVPKGDEITTIETIIKYTPTNFTSDVNSIKSREFAVTAEDTYTLSTGYSFIDKNTLDYKKSSSGLKNYIDIGKQIIPTSYKNKIGKEYYLTINGITFGSSLSNFGNGANYVCVQKFTKDSPDCVCPNDSDMAGKDLTGFIANNNETCADAQSKYCSSGSPDSPDSPDTKDYYCDKPMDNISILPCVNAGGTIEHCKATYCPIMDDIKCPNTYGVNDDSMDVRLRACVQTKMEQGLSKSQAIAICEPLVCPIGGRRIIYRTIRLENPFPSMNADTTVIQKSLRIGMFNNDVKGRYPGTNWNSTRTVDKKIRNNRKVSGTSIYQKKEPLYTFVLNGVTIKKIRDYNDKQKEGYNDFTLDCKKNKHAACVSYVFVHNENLSGLTGGTCQNISIDNGFYTCAE